jgi:hypothetical protein
VRFSPQAVACYMQEQLEKIWREAGIGGTYLAHHPWIYIFRAELTFSSFLATVGILMGIIMLTGANHGGLLTIAAFLGAGTFWLYLAGRVNALAQRGAIGSKWIEQYFDPERIVYSHDLPVHGRKLALQLKEILPADSDFYIHRLKNDPLVSFWVKGEHFFFYGWNEDREILETEGRLEEIRIPS